MSIENAKFRKPVVPGDQMRLTVTKDRRRGNVWRFNGVAHVDGGGGRGSDPHRHDHG